MEVKSADLYRMKGVLAIKDFERRFVFQVRACVWARVCGGGCACGGDAEGVLRWACGGRELYVCVCLRMERLGPLLAPRVAESVLS